MRIIVDFYPEPYYIYRAEKGILMAQFFSIMGRLAGQAMKTHAIDRAVTTAAGYIASEVRLAEVRLKLAILRRKRTRHLTILGRTVYRLLANDISPAGDERVVTLSRVLREIDGEIEAVEQELRQKIERERQRRNAGKPSQKSDTDRQQTPE